MEGGSLHIPTVILKDPDACSDYLEVSNSAARFYNSYTQRPTNPIAFEDAREILPIGWMTNVVMTMNCRELLHFFNERLCRNAQSEIRELAETILKKTQEILPEVFATAGPKCRTLGYCNEGRRSCGRTPTREEVFHIYNLHKGGEK